MAAKSYCRILDGDKVSTHSHPKVAACLVYLLHHYKLFQHTATRRWLQLIVSSPVPYLRFQHTATRRWLLALKDLTWKFRSFNTQPPEGGCEIKPIARNRCEVSTHSHPKVAATKLAIEKLLSKVSTHSHPKVAANFCDVFYQFYFCFNTQPPEGGCSLPYAPR